MRNCDARKEQAMQNSERQDIYTRVISKIIASLEQGVRPWMKRWSGENAAARISRPLRHNGAPYSGINILMLWSASLENGFTSPSWMTFRQALALNAHVRKGEKGSLVVYANSFTRTEEDAEGQEIDREIPFLKGYTVFNVDQIEGLPEHYYAKLEPRLTNVQRIEHVDAFFAATQADIRYGAGRAYYAQEADYIQLPPVESFRDAESFYATLEHESIYRTKHPSRLNRDFGRKIWGDEGYAREELVAELGAAFPCADLEITPEVQEAHASYIGTWVQALRNDTRAIFQAAAFAQRAVDYLHSLQPKQTRGRHELSHLAPVNKHSRRKRVVPEDFQLD
jgi:antirestriction protein ArdC